MTYKIIMMFKLPSGINFICIWKEGWNYSPTKHANRLGQQIKTIFKVKT